MAKIGAAEKPMECEWCGDLVEDAPWSDGNEHYFCSEMCLGQFEAAGGPVNG